MQQVHDARVPGAAVTRPLVAPAQLQVHWFSIINSLMIVLFLRWGGRRGAQWGAH